MSEAVAMLVRSTAVPNTASELHSLEMETRNRDALLLVRRCLRDSVVIPVAHLVTHGFKQRELA
ncbi:hypothetical protein D3C75_1183770 [compost metagenome]